MSEVVLLHFQKNLRISVVCLCMSAEVAASNSQGAFMYIVPHFVFFSIVESSDYLGQMVNVTVPAGETLTNFTVTILDDAILEEEELFSLALSIPLYPASLGIHSSAYATVTIIDDDLLTIQFAESSYSVSEGTGEVVLNLTANGTSAVNYTVVVDTVDGRATGKHRMKLSSECCELTEL